MGNRFEVYVWKETPGPNGTWECFCIYRGKSMTKVFWHLYKSRFYGCVKLEWRPVIKRGIPNYPGDVPPPPPPPPPSLEI